MELKWSELKQWQRNVAMQRWGAQGYYGTGDVIGNDPSHYLYTLRGEEPVERRLIEAGNNAVRVK